jgi:hypothetical protein
MTATGEDYDRLPLWVDKPAQPSAEVPKAGSRRPVVGLRVNPHLPITVEVSAGDAGEAGIGNQPNRVSHAALYGARHAEATKHHLGRFCVATTASPRARSRPCTSRLAPRWARAAETARPSPSVAPVIRMALPMGSGDITTPGCLSRVARRSAGLRDAKKQDVGNCSSPLLLDRAGRTAQPNDHRRRFSSRSPGGPAQCLMTCSSPEMTRASLS